MGFLESSPGTRQAIHLGTVQLFGNHQLTLDFSPLRQETSRQNRHHCLIYVRADRKYRIRLIVPEERMAAI